MIHSSLTAACCFENGFVGKQHVAWKEYFAKYWLKVWESMDRCTGRHDITEMPLETALNTIQSIDLDHSKKLLFGKQLTIYHMLLIFHDPEGEFVIKHSVENAGNYHFIPFTQNIYTISKKEIISGLHFNLLSANG